MDKFEYKIRSEEIEKLMKEERYAEAAGIADTIDWRRVRNLTTLLNIASLYKKNTRNDDCREILLLAYEKYPANRTVVFELCDISIKLYDVVAALGYFNQYRKIAPKDNGAIILRYRLLEAQDASMEERIALLEDLKAKDYQEEWAYELAYLYHRIGLATKCAEECDQIVLWFGNGPYVMKALELKMMHMPLTQKQQLKYDEMRYSAQEIYGDDSYGDEEYLGEENLSEYEMSNSEELYNEEAYADDMYTGEGYEGGAYAEGEYAGEGYEEDAYAENGYKMKNSAMREFSTEEFFSEELSAEGFPTGYYSDDNFYTEQTYDGNESHIIYEDDENSNYGKKTAGSPQPYADSDISRFNTINIQKVVAEGFKEISDDIFAEEREALQEIDAAKEPDEENLLLTKVVVKPEKPAYPEESIKPGEVIYPEEAVYNEAAEINTGSINKVILPDASARAIKADVGLDELRGTTERSVNEEHARMEQNLENVYRSAGADESPFRPMTGQMNINDVLSQWENIKLSSAKKHQEEIKKQIVTQTGKMFANFDDAVKNGVLEKLEKEAAVESADKQAADNEEAYDVSYTAPDTGIRTDVKAEAAAADELGITRMISREEIKKVLVSPPSKDFSEEDFLQGESYSGEPYAAGVYTGEIYADNLYPEKDFADDAYAEEINTDDAYAEEAYSDEEYAGETYGDEMYADEAYGDEMYADELYAGETYSDEYYGNDPYEGDHELDPEDEQTIAEMAKEDALRTHEIKLNTADLTNLSDKIVETAERETAGAGREEIREFTDEEQKLFENFAVTKKIKKQIIYALESMTLAAFTGNVIITGERGIDTVRMARNLLRKFQELEGGFSGKVAKITGEKLNQKNLKEAFEKVENGAIIIEKANGIAEEKLYELAMLLNQDNLGLVVIIEDTKKEITKLLEKQAMIADYFNIRIDLMEMDNNALVAYGRNYALALEYSIDEFGTLALYSRIANIQSGNHVVTKDEVREIIDEAITKSKKSKVKNFVDVLFARRYDSEDMIVLKERDFM